MSKQASLDLFGDIIPAVDSKILELWGALDDQGQKELKNNLWILNRFISNAESKKREIQEYFVIAVNEFYNKNWNEISKHPQLQWFTLCLCATESKQKQFHKYIPLKKESNKKEDILLKLFPDLKQSDVKTLSAITDTEQIKEYCRKLGWEDKEIADLKL